MSGWCVASRFKVNRSNFKVTCVVWIFEVRAGGILVDHRCTICSLGWAILPGPLFLELKHLSGYDEIILHRLKVFFLFWLICYCSQWGLIQYKDKTILRPSYLHNGISYTGKRPSLYWIRTWLFFTDRAFISPCNVLFSANMISVDFYPRPVLAFRYCRCLRVCVCVSVCPSITSLSVR